MHTIYTRIYTYNLYTHAYIYLYTHVCQARYNLYTLLYTHFYLILILLFFFFANSRSRYFQSNMRVNKSNKDKKEGRKKINTYSSKEASKILFLCLF